MNSYLVIGILAACFGVGSWLFYKLRPGRAAAEDPETSRFLKDMEGRPPVSTQFVPGNLETDAGTDSGPLDHLDL